MQVAVFHPGTQHSWQTALALQQLDLLEWYATTIFYQPERYPYRLVRHLPAPLARRLDAEFRRFDCPALDLDLVRTGGLSEWFERIATRAGMRGLAGRIDSFGNRRFPRLMADSIAGPAPFALWGYNGCAQAGFELGKANGRMCILDRTIGDARAYNLAMDALESRYGEWFIPSERRIPASAIRDDDQEYALADLILAGSEFAASTITQHAPDHAGKVQVLPYCFDEQLFCNQPEPQPVARGEPVKFLFVGQANPRKGIHLLLEAFADIPPSAASLTIVGDLRIPKAVFARFADRVTFIPQVPRSAIPQVMAEHHVLVFPSYFEGAGIVLYEALASGCALIQSDRCADAVSAGTGLLLDRLDSEAVHAALMSTIEDRGRLDAWRRQAVIESRRFVFSQYRENIAKLLANLG